MSSPVILISHNERWHSQSDEVKVSRYAQRRQQTVLLSVALLSLVVLCAVVLRILMSDRPRHLPVSGSQSTAKGASARIQTSDYLSTSGSASVITDTEVIVLQQVAQQLSCPSDVLVNGTTYSLACMVAAGHSITVRMQRFSSPSEARAAFDMARQERPLQYFHCYPSYSRMYDESPTGLVMRHRIRSWQADRWLMYTEAFDDTGYLIAPAPPYVSELVYEAASAYDLLAGEPCQVACLPWVMKH